MHHDDHVEGFTSNLCLAFFSRGGVNRGGLKGMSSDSLSSWQEALLMRLMAGCIIRSGVLFEPRANSDFLGAACQATAKKKEKKRANRILLERSLRERYVAVATFSF